MNFISSFCIILTILTQGLYVFGDQDVVYLIYTIIFLGFAIHIKQFTTPK